MKSELEQAYRDYHNALLICSAWAATNTSGLSVKEKIDLDVEYSKAKFKVKQAEARLFELQEEELKDE